MASLPNDSLFLDQTYRNDDLPTGLMSRPGLRYAERLRRLADLWPSLEDEERQQLQVHLHRLREKASA